MTAPLMPKATAVWLVENTALTFRQISKFCEIHELEIQAIADGDIAFNIVGRNPIHNGLLSWDEIHRCEADPTADLVANVLENNVKERNAKAKKILSPTQRSEKPSAILWILKNCPEIMDSQICKLIGTTKPTINKIRNGEYDTEIELKPKNPVTIGLCDEKDLENALAISKVHSQPKKKKAKARKKTAVKKAAAKKAPAKKAATKKTTAKKAVKATAKKTATVKKTAAKNAAAKKATTKKTTAKKAVKATAKKTATVKKTAAKKAPAKKAAAKKTTAKKAVKATAKKTTTVKKAAAKKAPAKKAATKKITAKKAVKATAKKTATVKKTAAKKAPAKKVAAKKTTARTKKSSK